MAKKRALGLSVKIIGLVVILFVLMLSLIVVMVTRRINTGVREMQVANIEQSARSARDLLDEVFLNLSRRVSLVARGANVIGAYEDEDVAALATICRDSYASLNNAYDILFTDGRGRVIANYPNTDMRGTDLTGLDFWEPVSSLRETAYIEPYATKAPDGTLVIAFSSPIVVDGRFAGAMMATLNLGKFSEEYILPLKYGKSGYAYVYDDRGTVVAHPDPALIGENLSGESFMQDMLASQDGSGIEYYEWEGQMKYVFFEGLRSLPWSIAAGVYETDMLSLSIEMRDQIIIISAVSLAVLVVILAFVIMAFVGKPISKITYGLSTGSGNLESASYQISSSSQELSSGSSELAASIEEITSSLEELQSVVELNTKNINQSELMMKETNEGAEMVTHRMGELKTAVNEIGENSKQIVKIIKVIEDIAFQTNILALNAAVEAARAGDAGRGFAVVADQVKELAHKSSEAAKETAVLIEKAMESAAKGEALGEDVMEVQVNAGEKSAKVGVLLDEVNRASKEQMKGINQITQAITQTNSVVQQTAASAEETAAASEELLSQAESLNGVVDELTLMVKGRLESGAATGRKTDRKGAQEKTAGQKSGGEGKNDAKPKSGERKEDSGISLASAEDQIPLEEEFSEF